MSRTERSSRSSSPWLVDGVEEPTGLRAARPVRRATTEQYGAPTIGGTLGIGGLSAENGPTERWQRGTADTQARGRADECHSERERGDPEEDQTDAQRIAALSQPARWGAMQCRDPPRLVGDGQCAAVNVDAGLADGQSGEADPPPLFG